MPQNILIPLKFPAVAPLNDTEIAIMGGYHGKNLSDVVVFNTKKKKCQKVIAGGAYKFAAKGN